MGRRSPDNPIDWELIEKEYRMGQLSLRQLATEFKVQPSAISRKAKKDGWVQDKSAAVKALSDSQLLLSNTRKATDKATPTPVDIEVAALARTNIVLSQRADIGRGRTVVMSLLAELENACGAENAALLAQLGELLRSPDENGQDKLNDLYQKLTSLPGRAKTMKDLGETLRVLITVERQAFGLDDPEDNKSAQLTRIVVIPSKDAD